MKRLCVYACVCASLLAVTSPVYAQGGRSAKGWLDVNFGAASAAVDGESRSVGLPLFGETATFGTEYNFPVGAHFDVGGGYMFMPYLGVGLSFSGDASEGAPDLNIRIPHPTFFNAFATDTATGDTKLMRTEGTVNIQVMVNATPRSDRWAIRFYGGPSFFRVTQDAVDDIQYSQTFLVFQPVQSVDITTFDIREIDGTGWGFHAGVDVGYYFSNVVGIGGGFKVSSADVTLEDVIGEYESNAGGVMYYGGLRLRFGR